MDDAAAGLAADRRIDGKEIPVMARQGRRIEGLAAAVAAEEGDKLGAYPAPFERAVGSPVEHLDPWQQMG